MCAAGKQVFDLVSERGPMTACAPFVGVLAATVHRELRGRRLQQRGGIRAFKGCRWSGNKGGGVFPYRRSAVAMGYVRTRVVEARRG